MILKSFVILVAALAIGAGVTAWRAAQLARATEAAYPPEGEFVDVDGVRLHYVQAGAGPDLIMIHGASGSTRDFTYQMVGALQDRYRVTVFDRPAFGYSDRVPGATIADQADLLAAAAGELGVESPVVLGQSYGGAVALAWAAGGHDAAALVLVSAPSNPWTTGIGAYYTALSSGAGLAIMAPLLSAWVPDGVINATLSEVFEPDAAPPDYAEHIGPRLSLRLDTMRENALQRRALLGEITAQVPHYGDITIPVEILHGTDDSIVPASIHSEPLAEQVPNSTLTLLEGIGHMPHHVALPPVLDAIDRVTTRAGLR